MPTSSSLALSEIFGIGLTISLEFEEAGTPQFALSRVEDAYPDSLWVSMPLQAGTFLPLPVGTPVIAHARLEDTGFLVHARVNGRRLQPSPMLELVPTSAVLRRLPRESSRLRLTLIPSSAVLLGPDGAQTRFATTIVNLSTGGLFLRGRRPLQVGQRIRLEVDLPAPGGLIDVTAEILRVDTRRAERGLYYEAGCSFLDLSEQARDLITRFVFRFQVRQRAASHDA